MKTPPKKNKTKQKSGDRISSLHNEMDFLNDGTSLIIVHTNIYGLIFNNLQMQSVKYDGHCHNFRVIANYNLS
jgi:hypothetical protein